MNEETQAPALWAYVEVMGHNKVAGRVSEVNFAGKVMLQVDVPMSESEFWTRYYNGDSIFSVTFCSEDEARRVAGYLKEKPLPLYMLADKVALPAPRYDPHALPFAYDPDEDEDGYGDDEPYEGEPFDEPHVLADAGTEEDDPPDVGF